MFHVKLCVDIITLGDNMSNRETILNDFYSNSDEDSRLLSQHGKVEFLTTCKYIDKCIKPDSKFVEIGAGTGRYSLFYADKGYDVTAIEYVQHNLDILKSNIKPNMNIRAEQGDAVDLSRFADDTFDVTVVLGPLYHLYDKSDVDKAISEAIRVTKKDGYVMFAYLTSDSIMIDWAIRDHHLIDGYPNDFDENFKMINYEEGIFSAYYVKEFMDIMNKYNNVDYVSNVATDGMTRHIKEFVDQLDNKEFEQYMKYHLSTCERYDLQGYSNHMLYICKKK